MNSVRVIDDQPFFAVVRRGETVEASYLRFHRTPEKAPAYLVKIYGPERSLQENSLKITLLP